VKKSKYFFTAEPLKCLDDENFTKKQEAAFSLLLLTLPQTNKKAKVVVLVCRRV